MAQKSQSARVKKQQSAPTPKKETTDNNAMPQGPRTAPLFKRLKIPEDWIDMTGQDSGKIFMIVGPPYKPNSSPQKKPEDGNQ